MTPPEVLAYRQNGSAPNAPGWDLRVVPNKFPALQVEGTLDREGDGMFDRMNGIGAHEVIIETPDHDRSLAAMSEPEIERVLWAYRERILDLKQDRRLRYILVFKNHGAAAGATLEHTALAADRAADRAGLRARGIDRRAAALRGEGALRVLRHRPPGSARRTPRHSGERRHRRAGAVRAAVSRSRRGCCRGATARGSRRRRGTSTRAWRGC